MRPDTPSPAQARADSPGQAVEAWLAELGQQRRYAGHTLAAYRRDLAALQQCFPDHALDALGEAQLRQALARLHAGGLKARSLARALSAWRAYFRWRAPLIGLARNPAQGIRAPRIPRSLPKALSPDHAQALLDRTGLPVPETPAQWRDLAMFEVLYSGGLRLAELVGLDHRPVHEAGYASHSWIDLDEGEALVRGKGGKSRSVPLGRHAIEALRQWLARRDALLPAQAGADTRAALFLGVRGARISPRVVQLQLDRLARQVGLPMHVHPHSLRHSFASHLLQSSQDLRAVQELLGHAHIATTQIYTRLDFQHLAASYDRAHPRARRKRP